jgi:hypothetical protein
LSLVFFNSIWAPVQFTTFKCSFRQFFNNLKYTF